MTPSFTERRSAKDLDARVELGPLEAANVDCE
jgi:hypothetical protein